jgi:16S rRNA G527 N7-methylase RsmG
MESMNKRCVFLEHVVDVIGSSNVQIVRGRAEVNSFLLIRIFNLIIQCVS